MIQTIEVTVGELASRSLAAVRVLEERGIDYCCGGRRALDDVCREKGIDSGALLAEVGTAESAAAGDGAACDWATAPLRDLIEHIVSTHHVYLRRELPLLGSRLVKVLEAHGPRHGDMLRPLASVFARLQAELESHMGKEEMILFPFVARAEEALVAGRRPALPPYGSVRNPIFVMEQEHDSAGSALAEMRRLTGHYSLPGDACAMWRALYDGLTELERDLHVHIHLENNILFPRAVAMESGVRK